MKSLILFSTLLLGSLAAQSVKVISPLQVSKASGVFFDAPKDGGSCSKCLRIYKCHKDDDGFAMGAEGLKMTEHKCMEFTWESMQHCADRPPGGAQDLHYTWAVIEMTNSECGYIDSLQAIVDSVNAFSIFEISTKKMHWELLGANKPTRTAYSKYEVNTNIFPETLPVAVIECDTSCALMR